ncbi:MAG: hypothetical protein AB7U73_16350, partial [Pirellulales bacterium]
MARRTSARFLPLERFGLRRGLPKLALAIAALLAGPMVAAAAEPVAERWLAGPQLTGDWLGARSRLADDGLTLQADNTSFLFGNPVGGVRQNLVYGGHGDYILTSDLGKRGLADGFFVKLRAEHRFGETIVNDVGCFISPTLLADLPVFQSEQLYLTNVLFTQKVGDSLALFAGKMDTLDGDPNAIAHGRGKTQFS